MLTLTRLSTIVLLLLATAACTTTPSTETSPPGRGTRPLETSEVVAAQDDTTASATCPLSEPDLITPPDDAAVQGSPVPGHYFVNEDRSIWTGAWWINQEEEYLRTGDEGIKVGWFRPAGATLEISGRRIDAAGPPMKAEVPCCYPTRFQATGLIFPTKGCWEVTAKAGESELSFVVWVEP